jgi:anthranilate synthase component 1
MCFRISPSLEEFKKLSREGNLIPLVVTFVADAETPISAFAKLRHHGPCFLFESAEKTEESGRFSFIGVEPLLTVQGRDNLMTVVEGGRSREFSSDRDPLTELRDIMKRFRSVPRPDLPHFIGGAVGYLGFDVIHFFEPKVNLHPTNDLGLPEFAFMIARLLIVFDHRLRKMHVVSNAWVSDATPEHAYDQARQSLEWAIECLRQPTVLPAIPTTKPREIPVPQSNTSQPEFETMVDKAKEAIAAGEIYQVVLSQRFETAFAGDELDLYRCLRFGNPSPYMFCLKLSPDAVLLGSSPEVHVRVRNGSAEIRPIAGTHRRGTTPAEDEKLALALLADPKERAEHVMLIDLGRNDLGRVAEFGSVRVTEQMVVEHYSHVMHIVSHVVARLRPDQNAFDAVRATFPAGTLSGAPKIRAMQFIAELEKARRGFYGGIVGYFGFDGSHDSCIAIRSIALKNGKAYLQTGAGIVADSEPAREYQECLNKANAMLDAIGRTNEIVRYAK